MKKIIISNLIALFLPILTFGADLTVQNPLGKNTTITAILNNVLDYLIKYIAPPVATIMALYVAFLYMTSGGVPDKVQKAHKTLTWLIVGIAVLLLARGIVSTIQATLGL